MNRRRCRFARLTFLFVASATGGTQAQVPNDDCADAIPITDGTYFGTTRGASVDGAPGCSGLCECYPSSGTAPDVWYLYTATCEGSLEVDTCGSDPFDTWLSIHEPGCSGVELACNEDACGPGLAPWQSRVKTRVAEAQQVLIRVSGWGGDTGDFELHVTCTPTAPPGPLADRCAEAVPLEVPTWIGGSTVDAAYDPAGDLSAMGWPRESLLVGRASNPLRSWHGCGRHNQFEPEKFRPPGRWYTVVGTGNLMTATVAGEDDHGITIFCDGCDRLICVEGGSSNYAAELDEVTWCSRAGQPYAIWVYASDVAAPGEYALTVVDEGTPCYGGVDCNPVEVVDTFVRDDGDNDGWADTNEAVQLRFTVTNRGARRVTGLAGRLSVDPEIASIAEPEFYVGDLAPGETRMISAPVILLIADIDRPGNCSVSADVCRNDQDCTGGENCSRDAAADFVASFEVHFTSDQFQDLDPRRCSVSGATCSAHQDCPATNVCTNRHCTISGVECVNSRDCASGAGESCAGRCSLTQDPCDDGIGLACETVLDYCVDEAQKVVLDLDLDVGDGSGPTEFFEGFEANGLGAFEEHNLDAGRNSLEASDQQHCQYYDPDTNGISAGLGYCWFGADAPHTEAFFWQVDDGRAFSGLRSLYMGIEVYEGEFTTPMGTLEGVATTEPVNLGWGRVCEASAASCDDDLDCPSGEECIVAIPELSFKHQVSLIDDRYQNNGGHLGLASGVVQVQVVDSTGAEIVPWQTIEPKINRYDSSFSPTMTVCGFDPADDGSTEDNLFDFFVGEKSVGSLAVSRYSSLGAAFATHGAERQLGPSSMCFPRQTFASAGDTDELFDPTNLNGPAEGPGLRGDLGLGTWVESVFSLDRYRGRRIRIRFLASNANFTANTETWEGANGGPGAPNDDGWWIDDVRVTHTLMEPATVTADTKANSAFGFDGDGDHAADSIDCDPQRDDLWFVPGEVHGLRVSHTGGSGGTSMLSWGRPVLKGATDVSYVVVSREGAGCTETNAGAGHTLADPITPPPGVLRQFLVQAENDCGRGPLGHDSTHNPRTGCD